MPSSSEESNKKMRMSGACWFRGVKVRDLVRSKRRLVEVPYTATLNDTVHSLVANKIGAVPIAAPPGHYIGAGGSMILESDPVTGAVRKHYIGMITMLDVLLHIADGEPAGDADVDLDGKLAVSVSSIIGLSMEGLNLWTLNPNSSIMDCMETFSRGVHRALVPLESQSESAITLEFVEASPGYRMLTQMDLLSFLQANMDALKDVMICSVGDLGAINQNIFAVTNRTRVFDAIRSMRSYFLGAVPVVTVDEGDDDSGEEKMLQDGRGRKLIDTFSATDLRLCSVPQLQSMLKISVSEFKDRISAIAFENGGDFEKPKLVSCRHESTLEEVISEAVSAHVHRVWVVDEKGLLTGIVSLTDILKAIRNKVLAAAELDE